MRVSLPGHVVLDSVMFCEEDSASSKGVPW